MNAIELRDVTLALGGHNVLANISLNIPAGQFIGVLGPNGAGKTTLMRAILGLLSPTNGAIRVLDKPRRRAAILRSAIGRRPPPLCRRFGSAAGISSPALRTVSGPVCPFSLPRPRAQVHRALELVGAEQLARRPLTELSGGERQRLLLAQALIGDPKLLLLDEPLISLDPRRQQEAVELVKRLQTDLGITVLFSAHELNPLLNAIDQVLYLGSGHAALGRVEDVVTPPVLSRLYGAPIDVIRVRDRIFVMSGGHDVERDDHRHEHDHPHSHAHEDHSHV